MLTVTRRENEWITIRTPSGETIRLSVHDIRGRQVKLTFYADRDVRILRSEIDKAKA